MLRYNFLEFDTSSIYVAIKYIGLLFAAINASIKILFANT